MFLTRLIHTPLRDEGGSALAGVLGIMAVTAVIAVTVSASTINALGVTTSTRASVQARAAAEAGIDQALVDVKAGCTATRVNTAEPRYEYELQYATTDTGSPTWVDGCPPDDAKLLKIESTGFAYNTGVAGASSGDSRLLEAIYTYVPVYIPDPHEEAAVYAHTIEGALRNFHLDSSADNLSADVQIKNGNVECENNATIDGNVVLANGYVDLDNCNVNGSIKASKYIHINGNNTTVLGEVIASGIGEAAGSSVVSLTGGSTAKERIYAGGSVVIDARAEKDVTAAGSPSSLLRVRSHGEVGGSATSSGAVQVDTGAVTNTVSSGVGGLAAPPAPQVPSWTDIPYPTAATTWDGYTYVRWAGACTVGGSHPFWTGLTTLTGSGKILVDATDECGAAGINFQNNSQPIILKANVSFIAHKFLIDKLTIQPDPLAPATVRYLWFIVPDNTANGQPTCPVGGISGDITLTNEADIDPTIAAMVYTPCKVISDRNNWRGQYYGGTVEFRQQATISYAPVGVPGIDFSVGLPPADPILDHALLGSRVSLHERGSGG